MGTTESIPEDEAPPPSEELRENFPSAADRPDGPRGPPPPPSRPQQELHPTHERQQQRPQRPRPRPPPGKPIYRLEGLIVGGPKAGKRSLLQRLEGKDPFRNDQEGDASVSKSPLSASIIVPYKPPPESLTFDRIQLHIQCIHASDRAEEYFHQHQKQQTQTAFAVILVSPKHKLETTQSYIERLLTMHLDSLGYEMKDKDKDGKVVHPVCLCFLLNFRDAVQSDFPNIAQLENCVNEILQERGVSKRMVVIDWINVSLLNCYGLNRLHTFIYKAYLLRKEALFEQQLLAVRQQMKLTSQAIDKAPASYEEFVKTVAPPVKEVPPSSQPVQNGDEQRRTIHPTTKPSKVDEAKPMNGKSKRDEQPSSRPNAHQRFPLQSKSTKQKQQQQPSRMGKDALEAFLASSSDEEDVKAKRRTKVRPPSSSSSDDDDDDDFFYDEKGQRKYNHQAPASSMNQSDSSSDSEEEFQPPMKLQTPTIEQEDSASESQSHHDQSDEEQNNEAHNRGDNSVSKNEDPDIGKEDDSSHTSAAKVKIVASHNDDDDDDDITSPDNNTEELTAPTVNGPDPDKDSSSKDDHSSYREIEDSVTSDEPTLKEEANESVKSDMIDEKSVDESTRSNQQSIDDDSIGADDDPNSPALPPSSENPDHEEDIYATGAVASDKVESDEEDAFMVKASKSADSDSDDEFVIESSGRLDKPTKISDDIEDDDDYVIHATRSATSIDGDEEDQRRVDAVKEAGQITEASPIRKTQSAVHDSDDDDDNDGSVIGDNSTVPNSGTGTVPVQIDSTKKDSIVSAFSQPQQSEHSPNAPQNEPTTKNGGLSAAAMAAVLAAQQEAELMLQQQSQQQQQQQQYSSSHPAESEKKRTKKSKKKKSGKEKKKKKKAQDDDYSA